MRPVPPIIPSPTPTPPPAVKVRSCLLWGDPHLVSFDGARPSFYGNGEYWIVKNDDVHTQGRFMGTKYTYGLAATQKVAIGGRFLKNHIIEVEPMEHKYGGHLQVGQLLGHEDHDARDGRRHGRLLRQLQRLLR